MEGSFLFLGTGASAGVPIIGCVCAVCQSKEPKNKRLRSSGLLKIGDKTLLIDIGPDFRQQVLKHKIDHIDGLLLTHTHFDHIAGIDEIRILNFRQKQAFPCLLSEESLSELHIRYHYLFMPQAEGSSYTAELNCQVLPDESGTIDFCGVNIGYTSYKQGKMKVNGFRVGNFAYISDIREYDDDIFSFLDGVEFLILSALRKEPSHIHFSFDEAAAFSKRVKAKKTWLTHLSHAVDYETTLPSNVQLGFDGMELFFKVSH
jgi:phosphoribosyl 1,2-cyclic phosphate phosphodiesterase